MKTFRITTLFLFLIPFAAGVHAQTTELTFSVNLKPQLQDSTFVPGRDQLVLVGNLPPINGLNPYFLVDEIPVDSIYSVTVRFPSRLRNQELTYNFEMTTNGRKQTELMPRAVKLLGREIELDALYFNAFAW